jgi:hypothetical protein
MFIIGLWMKVNTTVSGNIKGNDCRSKTRRVSVAGAFREGEGPVWGRVFFCAIGNNRVRQKVLADFAQLCPGVCVSERGIPFFF